ALAAGRSAQGAHQALGRDLLVEVARRARADRAEDLRRLRLERPDDDVRAAAGGRGDRRFGATRREILVDQDDVQPSRDRRLERVEIVGLDDLEVLLALEDVANGGPEDGRRVRDTHAGQHAARAPGTMQTCSLSSMRRDTLRSRKLD